MITLALVISLESLVGSDKWPAEQEAPASSVFYESLGDRLYGTTYDGGRGFQIVFDQVSVDYESLEKLVKLALPLETFPNYSFQDFRGHAAYSVKVDAEVSRLIYSLKSDDVPIVTIDVGVYENEGAASVGLKKFKRIYDTLERPWTPRFRAHGRIQILVDEKRFMTVNRLDNVTLFASTRTGKVGTQERLRDAVSEAVLFRALMSGICTEPPGGLNRTLNLGARRSIKYVNFEGFKMASLTELEALGIEIESHFSDRNWALLSIGDRTIEFGQFEWNAQVTSGSTVDLNCPAIPYDGDLYVPLEPVLEELQLR